MFGIRKPVEKNHIAVNMDQDLGIDGKLECTTRPHVVMVPLPNAQGHVNPMMELAKRLAARGVLVTFITIDYALARLLHVDSNRRLYQRLGVRFMGVPDGLPATSDRHLLSTDYIHMLDRVGLEIRQRILAMANPIIVSDDDDIAEAQQDNTDHHGHVTCIVVDVCFIAYLTAAGPVPGLDNIPLCAFWSQSATVFSAYCLAHTIQASHGFDPFLHNVPPFQPKKPEYPEITCLPGLHGIEPAYLPYYTGLGKEALEEFRKWIENTVRPLGKESLCILANTFEDLEGNVFSAAGTVLPPNFYAVGPLIPSAYLMTDGHGDDKDTERRPANDIHDDSNADDIDKRSGASFWDDDYEECMKWLGAQPEGSVVYVSFGSLARFTPAQIREVALGLLASGQRFLWVIRKDSILTHMIDDSCDADDKGTKHIVDGTGESHSDPLLRALPQEFVATCSLTNIAGGDLHAGGCDVDRDRVLRGKIVPWCPQLAVLSHPAVGGFFSHCGWNSVLESLAAGVPILAWPCIVDQATNCWQLVRAWKIGLELPRDASDLPSRDTLKDALTSIMVGDKAQEMRAAAKALQSLARTAVSRRTCNLGSSQKSLQLFVESLYKMANASSTAINGQGSSKAALSED